jgi:hypothetical protein
MIKIETTIIITIKYRYKERILYIGKFQLLCFSIVFVVKFGLQTITGLD